MREGSTSCSIADAGSTAPCSCSTARSTPSTPAQWIARVLPGWQKAAEGALACDGLDFFAESGH